MTYPPPRNKQICTDQTAGFENGVLATHADAKLNKIIPLNLYSAQIVETLQNRKFLQSVRDCLLPPRVESQNILE